jgi:hypothetical protein
VLVTVMLTGLVIIARKQLLPWLLPLLFTVYLVYGFIRPRLSRRLVHEIEDAEDEPPDT